MGLGNILDDTPAHLPDIYIFKLEDVIAGPLEINALKGTKFEVPNYDYFKFISKVDRISLAKYTDKHNIRLNNNR